MFDGWIKECGHGYSFNTSASIIGYKVNKVNNVIKVCCVFWCINIEKQNPHPKDRGSIAELAKS